ncbi:OLC1v1000610C1 [Oldenlandia corymbosa var. corymbosa]|uniref:OLC1v1000610C1 n=1 Tax=Oldenlandia corymbosa var. corymbosa TaxID=529605 RepID=A0AAV1D5S4_OLDCO|nr:OLC1v1000610C1 [Oldenlandia corymbosa var. corymbosa]
MRWYDCNRLWRCGPPEKPVLCNACGLRWRTRKTLEDYVPKHVLNPSLARDDDDNNDDYKEELDGLNVKSSSHRHDTVDLDQGLITQKYFTKNFVMLCRIQSYLRIWRIMKHLKMHSSLRRQPITYQRMKSVLASLFGTPLWRCGPPEKPVLCNACGSRYRKNLPLENYIPKHGIDPSNLIANLQDEVDDQSVYSSRPQVLKNVVRKRRSERVEYSVPSTAEVLNQSKAEILRQKLWDALQDPELSKDLEDYEEPENALITQKTTYYIPETEVGGGCEFIKSTN